MTAWNRTLTASFLADNAEWHHMAVTWTKEHNGRMRIFKDGLMMSEVRQLSPRGIVSNIKKCLNWLHLHFRIWPNDG